MLDNFNTDEKTTGNLCNRALKKSVIECEGQNWEVLKPALAEYYEETVSPHMYLRQLSIIRPARREDIQSYVDRLLV